MLRRLALQTMQTAAVRQLIRTWCNYVAPHEAPWFEQPDAGKAVDRLRARAEIDDVDAARLQQWTRDGYFIVRNAVPAADIDEIGSLMDGLASARRPLTGVKLLGLREPGQSVIMDLTHREFLQRYAREERVKILSESPWRIHGLHRWHRSVRRVFRNEELLRFASLIFQHRAVASWSITFARGSGQALHQDMAVFHVQPRGFLIGCWIACEDIAADSGPLVFCPGSHRSEWFPEFNEYPQTNLRTATFASTQRYHEWIARESGRFEQKRFLARKGDVLFWHSMLFHGGDAIQRADSTRRSLVIHYRVRGTDRAWTVSGPFNW